MLYVFQAQDGKNVGEKRSRNYPAHHAHLEAQENFGVKIIFSGPLLGDDEITPVGSMLVVDAPNRETAENYFKCDPFSKDGVWDKTHIYAFKKVKG